MSVRNTGGFERAHVARWLEITGRYLFADRDGAAGAAEASRRASQSRSDTRGIGACGGVRDAKAADDGLRGARADNRGARLRFMSRVRGRLMRLVKHAPPRNGSALRELASAFCAHVSFIARNPEVPRRMLRWSLDGEGDRISRRLRRMMERYVDHLSRIIDRAQRQGEIATTVEPRGAALLLVSMIQGLALRIVTGTPSPERAMNEAATLFALYLDGIGAGAPV